MRAASLFAVFVLAKAAVLSEHTIPVSTWAPAAYFWQDGLVALLFGLLEWRLSRRFAVPAYWTLVLYTALNIPVGRAVSTPLTWPMLRAARGPLADSILLYFTWSNAVWVALTLSAAAALPLVLRRWSWKMTATSLTFVALGPMAAARVDTFGLERNAVATLFASGIPRLPSRQASGDWRASPFPQTRGEDLTQFRGIAKGRNVIVVSLESTAAQYLSLYGGEYDLTPNLTALARNAIVFDNAYSAYPESIKGLYSVLCSMFPAFDSDTKAYESAPCRPVPEVFAQAGYRTALFHSGRFGYLGMESIIRNRGYQTLEDAGDIGGNHESSFGVDEPATVVRMLAWIDALPRGQRFFLTYLPIAGHHPYETPERGSFPEHDELGRYRNALLYGDASLGTLIEGVRSRGLADNTVWVIFGDHGEAFGQHEGNYGHTFFLYEENIHVPLVIAAPGLLHGQTRSRKVVSLVDVAPTVLDLLGFPLPGGYQGKTALDAEPHMALFFADYSLGLLGLRDGRYKFIYDLGSGRSRMFDLSSDPQEKTDIAQGNAQRVARYSSTVKAWSGAQKSYLTKR
jgi:glucan phosphoethanolaminetransferase (alkaline phosphatase superfamily)